MTLSTLLSLFFKPSTTLRLGVSRTSRSTAYALVAVPAKGKPSVVWAGKDLPLWVRLIAPPVVHGDLGDAPVHLVHGSLNGKDAEAWIDASESTIIPAGISPDKVVNEYATIGSVIYAATVSRSARDAAAVPPEKERLLAALYAPLWNIAGLYHDYLKGPFIIWKISSDGSILGRVRNGRLEKVVNCYINSRDLEADRDGSAQTIRKFILQLSGESPEIPVVACSPEADYVVPRNGTLPSQTLVPVPTVPGVPAFCHEAYAHCCSNDGALNFISFDSLQKTRRLGKRDRSLRSILRMSVVTVAALAFALAALDGALRIIDKKYSGSMELLKTQEAIVGTAEKRHDKLLDNFRDKLHFATERSRVTGLLSGLQNVLPENAWAEALSITSVEQQQFQVAILAATTESGLISATLEHFGKVPGVIESRLVSSEQVTLPDKRKAVRFKLKGLWRFAEETRD